MRLVTWSLTDIVVAVVDEKFVRTHTYTHTDRRTDRQTYTQVILYLFNSMHCIGQTIITKQIETRLPSNLRPNTHLVTRCHLRSRDKDGGHTHHLISGSRKHFAAGKLHGSVLLNRSYCRSKFYIAGIGIFDHFCSRDLDLDPMTFIYELDSYFLEIHRMCKYECSTSRLSKVMVRETVIRTYSHDVRRCRYRYMALFSHHTHDRQTSL